ncbi:MAG: hypothetical protein MH252_15845 [Thermosynechococcaceae cyanobacterium MS004]|nr:hypothetical protein [Thermosynechococcaceae cyanobacterium MS004]
MDCPFGLPILDKPAQSARNHKPTLNDSALPSSIYRLSVIACLNHRTQAVAIAHESAFQCRS